MRKQEADSGSSSETEYGSKCFSHYGVRPRRLQEMIDWYKIFFSAEARYGNDFAAFTTFDDERHRLVFWTDENNVEKNEELARPGIQ